MEENITPKRKSSLKGAVLFTVLCVMAVMLVLVLSTITLAGVASKRAYSEYQDAQVVATAKSVVDSVITSLAPGGENAALGTTIYKEIAKDTNKPYTIYIKDGGNLGSGLGVVEKLEFSYAGDDRISDYYIEGSNYMIMKVTATVRMGTETTTYTEYLSDMVYSAGSGGDGGLLSTSGVNTPSTGITVIGPFGGGLNQMVATTDTVNLTNEGVHIDTVSFNSSISLNVKKLFLFDVNTPATSYDPEYISKSNYQGMTVLGNLSFDSDGVSFMARNAATTAKETPYVFVTGEINYGNCSVNIGTYMNDTPNKDNLDKKMIGNKLNVYCGNFVCGKQSKDINASADIFCYNESMTSLFGGVQSATPLLNWIADQQASGKYTNSNTMTGNIYSKGSVKLKASDLCIDGNLYVEGKLDLSDITGNNVPQVTGTIYADNIIRGMKADGTENTEQKYLDLIAKIKPLADAVKDNASFPADKELEEILGIKFNETHDKGSEKLKAINNGLYTLNSVTDLSNKIIQNPMEMNLRFYVTDPSDETKKVLKGSKSASGVTTTAVISVGSDGKIIAPASVNAVIDDAAKSIEIKSDCTLKGTFNGWTININPGNDTSKPLWINLDNAAFTGDSNIIVEDRAKDSSGNYIYDAATGKHQKAAPVCFYIVDKTSLTLNKSRIITKFYDENYFKGGKALAADLDLVSSPDPEYIPGIYIYGNNDESSSGAERIELSNNAFITGYIIAPRANLRVTDAGAKFGDDIKFTYNGIKYNNQKIGVIGSVIVGPIGNVPGVSDPSGVANDFTVVYVSDSTGDDEPPMEKFAYKKIPGYSTY